MNKSFSIEKAFSVSWAIFQKHVGFLVGLELFVILVSQGFPLLLKHFSGEMNHTLFLASRMLVYALVLILTMGLIRVSLRLLDEDKGQWSDMFKWDLVPKYLATAVAFALILFAGPVGSMQLIRSLGDYFVHRGNLFPHASILIYSVIGIWVISIILVPVWLLRYFFCMYAVVDRQAGPYAALKQSSEISRGNRMKILGLIFALTFLNLVGAVALGIGLIVTSALSHLIGAYCYRELSKA